MVEQSSTDSLISMVWKHGNREFGSSVVNVTVALVPFGEQPNPNRSHRLLSDFINGREPEVVGSSPIENVPCYLRFCKNFFWKWLVSLRNISAW
jgi:hypothetical protein